MRNTPEKWFAFFHKWKSTVLVIGTWHAGILCGCLLAVFAGDTYHSILLTVSSHPVSIAGLAASIILPAALLCIAAMSNIRWLLLLTVFIKVVSVTACSVSLTAVYGSAGWLVRLFVQFSDTLTLPAFCWLSLRCINKSYTKVIFAAVSVWYLLVCWTDYCVISPFFAGLIVN